MNILIRILSLILILLVFIIALLGGLYILVVEIDYILEVDILWKLKEKVRVIVYGRSKRETLDRLFRRRKIRSLRNRKRLQAVKGRLFNRQDHVETIQIQKNKTNQKA